MIAPILGLIVKRTLRDFKRTFLQDALNAHTSVTVGMLSHFKLCTTIEYVFNEKFTSSSIVLADA